MMGRLEAKGVGLRAWSRCESRGGGISCREIVGEGSGVLAKLGFL